MSSERESSDEAIRSLQDRVRDFHPTIYLTFVSIIVALVLEDLLSIVRGLPGLWSLSAESIFRWIQIVVAFEAASATWIGYCHLMITIRWALGLWDALSVLWILVVLYLINSTIESGNAVLWFFFVGGFFLAGAIVFITNLRRGRADPGGREIIARASYGVQIAEAAATGTIALFFGLLLWSGAVGATGAVIMGGIIAAGYTAWPILFIRAWRRSISLS